MMTFVPMLLCRSLMTGVVVIIVAIMAKY